MGITIPSAIDPSQIPDTLPGYLINLKAEFTIGNEIIATENAGTMGTELHETLGYWDPLRGWDVSQNTPTAGVYQAIGLDLQGSSPEYAAQPQANLEATKAKLESADDVQLQTLTKQEIVGDLLEATIFSYFAMNNIQDDIAAQQANIVNYRQPSFGKFSTSLTTSYWFGTPRNVSASGLVMDVDRVFNSQVDKDNNLQKRLNFNKMVGNRLSAMEHLVPERMFPTEEAPAEGISAVKALALASAQGQKIWTITKDNLQLALDSINLDADTENEIRNSVHAGMVVTAHEQSLNFNGWIGEGYIILDPETGAGAYKIAGGGNGGALLGFSLVLGLFMFFASVAVLSFLAAPGFLAAIAIGWIGVNFYFWTEGIKNAQNHQQFNTNNAMAALALSLGFLSGIPLGLMAMVIFVDSWIFMLGLS